MRTKRVNRMHLRFDVVGDDVLTGEPCLDFDALSDSIGCFITARGLGHHDEISVSLSFVDERQMRELNARYRDIDESTDVLSFPLWEEETDFRPPADWPELPLGDVVVSPAHVRENAKNQEVDYNNEIILVIVHGVLHLIGFDHDTEDRKNAMWREQETLVEKYFEKIRGGLMSE